MMPSHCDTFAHQLDPSLAQPSWLTWLPCRKAVYSPFQKKIVAFSKPHPNWFPVTTTTKHAWNMLGSDERHESGETGQCWRWSTGSLLLGHAWARIANAFPMQCSCQWSKKKEREMNMTPPLGSKELWWIQDNGVVVNSESGCSTEFRTTVYRFLPDFQWHLQVHFGCLSIKKDNYYW